MYKKLNYSTGLIKCNRLAEGETIEDKVKRLVNNKEPIKDGSPLIYTEKKDGVNPAYNIRTDRFEIACEAMDKVHRSKLAKKEDKPTTEKEAEKEAKTVEMKPNKNDSGAESTHGEAEISQSK